MPIGHDSDKATAKRTAELAKIDVYMDRILSILDEYPSEYKGTLELVEESRKEVTRNIKKAAKLAGKAYHLAEDESLLVIRYHRIIDRITPEDPVLKEPKVAGCIDDYKSCIRKNDLDGAKKALVRLEKAIGGRGEPSSLSLRLGTTRISRDDRQVSVILSNVGVKDVVINSITATATTDSEHVEVKEPVIRKGNSTTITLGIDPGDADSVVFTITVTYTKDFVPVTQSFPMKVMVGRMYWKCRMGHYVDQAFDKCVFCGSPKPGTVKSEEIEYAITLDFVQDNVSKLSSVYVKGPAEIGTDASHERVYVRAGGAEVASFDWDNTCPHGQPLRIEPLPEGGFKVACSSPMFLINGAHVKPMCVVPSGFLLFLSETMMIKLEDGSRPAFLAGCLSPVGVDVPDGIPDDALFKPRNSGFAYYNGMSPRTSALYSVAGISEAKPWDGANLDFVNRFVLREYGLKLRESRDVLAKLRSA